MYFNLSRYLLVAIFALFGGVFGAALWFLLLPFKVVLTTLGYFWRMQNFLFFRPLRRRLQSTLFKPAPPKRYVKANGKPAVPAIAATITSRPAMGDNAGLAMAMPVAYTTRASRVEMLKRSLLQQEDFKTQFRSQVVAV